MFLRSAWTGSRNSTAPLTAPISTGSPPAFVRAQRATPPIDQIGGVGMGSSALTGIKPMTEIALDFKHFFGRLPVFFGGHDGRNYFA
jgi:hypothetical protein